MKQGHQGNHKDNFQLTVLFSYVLFEYSLLTFFASMKKSLQMAEQPLNPSESFAVERPYA